jgi:P27 family predicted phage terminase small subunit
MGRRGPLPEKYPENVMKLRAGVSHSSPKHATRKLRPKAPAKPRWLTPYGSRVWDRVVRELDPLGLLASVDRDILSAYCDAAAFAKEARDQLVDSGLTRVGQRGETVKHPLWAVWRQAVSMMESLGTRLALNPSARLRMLADLPDDDDSDLD